MQALPLALPSLIGYAILVPRLNYSCTIISLLAFVRLRAFTGASVVQLAKLHTRRETPPSFQLVMPTSDPAALKSQKERTQKAKNELESS
jgi:hypothetical protein